MNNANPKSRVHYAQRAYALGVKARDQERQRGQALLEGAAALLVLLSIWVGCAWLARFQDMALQASHASRFAAFSLARDPDSRPVGVLRQSYFSGPGHQWKDRRGREILGSARGEITLSALRNAQLPSEAQPGGGDARAMRLRREWHLEDGGIFSARVTAAPKSPAAGFQDARSFGSGLRQFDEYYPRLVRHTAILSGAGHGAGDHDTQIRVGQSALGWRDAAETSYGLARQLASAVGPVDAGWKRPRPGFDWLDAWRGMVPEQHVDVNTKELQ